MTKRRSMTGRDRRDERRRGRELPKWMRGNLLLIAGGAATAGVLGGIPGNFPFGRYTGEVLAGSSGVIDGIGCASPVSANGGDRLAGDDLTKE